MHTLAKIIAFIFLFFNDLTYTAEVLIGAFLFVYGIREITHGMFLFFIHRQLHGEQR